MVLILPCSSSLPKYFCCSCVGSSLATFVAILYFIIQVGLFGLQIDQFITIARNGFVYSWSFIVIMWTILSLAVVVSAGIMLYGICNRKESKIMPFLVLELLSYVGNFNAELNIILEFGSDKYVYIILDILYLALRLYFWLLLYTFYLKLLENKNQENQATLDVPEKIVVGYDTNI